MDASNIIDRIRDAYLSAEERYYSFLDWLSERGIPLNRVAEAIESRGIPSFPVMVIALLLLFGGIGWSIYAFLLPHTYTVTIYGPDGSPLSNTTVYIDGKRYMTDAYGQVQLKGVKGPVTVEVPGYESFSFDPRTEKEISLEAAKKKVVLTVNDEKTGKNISLVNIKVYGDGDSRTFYSSPAVFYISQARTDGAIKVKEGGKVIVEIRASGYSSKTITISWNDSKGLNPINKTVLLKPTSTGSAGGEIVVYVRPSNVSGLAKLYKNDAEIDEKIFQVGIVTFDNLTKGTYKIVFEPEINGHTIVNPYNTIYVNLTGDRAEAHITLHLPGYDGNSDEYNAPEDIASYYAVVHVYDEAGNPIRGAYIVDANTGERVGRSSDSDGAIEIGFEEEDGELNVYVTHPDYYPSDYFKLAPGDDVNVVLKSLPAVGKVHLCVVEPWTDGEYAPVPSAYYSLTVADTNDQKAKNWKVTGNVGDDGCATIDKVPVGTITVHVTYPTGDFPTDKNITVKKKETTDVNVVISRKVAVTVNVYRSDTNEPIFARVSAEDEAGTVWAKGVATYGGGATLEVPAFMDIRFVIKYGKNYTYSTDYMRFQQSDTVNVYVPVKPENEVSFEGIYSEDGKAMLMLDNNTTYYASFGVTCVKKCSIPLSAKNAALGTQSITVDCGDAICHKTVRVPIIPEIEGETGTLELDVNGSPVKIPVGYALSLSDGCDSDNSCARTYAINQGQFYRPTELQTYTEYIFWIPFAAKMDVDEPYIGVDTGDLHVTGGPHAQVLGRVGKYVVGIANFTAYSEDPGNQEVVINVEDLYNISQTLHFYDAGTLKDMNAIVDQAVPADCQKYGINYKLVDVKSGMPIRADTITATVDGKTYKLDAPTGVLEIPTTGDKIEIVFSATGYRSATAEVNTVPITVKGSAEVEIREPDTNATGTVSYEASRSDADIYLNGTVQNVVDYNIVIEPSNGNTSTVTVQKLGEGWNNRDESYDVAQDGNAVVNGYTCSVTALTTVKVHERTKDAPDAKISVSDSCRCKDDKYEHVVTLTPSEGEITAATLAGKDCKLTEGGKATCVLDLSAAKTTVSAEINVNGIPVIGYDTIELNCGGSDIVCPTPVLFMETNENSWRCDSGTDAEIVDVEIWSNAGEIKDIHVSNGNGNAKFAPSCTVEEGNAYCTVEGNQTITADANVVVDPVSEKTVSVSKSWAIKVPGDMSCGGGGGTTTKGGIKMTVKTTAWNCVNGSPMATLNVEVNDGTLTKVYVNGGRCEITGDRSAECNVTVSESGSKTVEVSATVEKDGEEVDLSKSVQLNVPGDMSCGGECAHIYFDSITIGNPPQVSDDVLWVAEVVSPIVSAPNEINIVVGKTSYVGKNVLPESIFIGTDGDYVVLGNAVKIYLKRYQKIGDIYVYVKDISVDGDKAILDYGIPRSACGSKDQVHVEAALRCGRRTVGTVRATVSCEGASKNGGQSTGNISRANGRATLPVSGLKIKNGKIYLNVKSGCTVNSATLEVMYQKTLLSNITKSGIDWGKYATLETKSVTVEKDDSDKYYVQLKDACDLWKNHLKDVFDKIVSFERLTLYVKCGNKEEKEYLFVPDFRLNDACGVMYLIYQDGYDIEKIKNTLRNWNIVAGTFDNYGTAEISDNSKPKHVGCDFVAPTVLVGGYNDKASDNYGDAYLIGKCVAQKLGPAIKEGMGKNVGYIFKTTIQEQPVLTLTGGGENGVKAAIACYMKEFESFDTVPENEAIRAVWDKKTEKPVCEVVFKKLDVHLPYVSKNGYYNGAGYVINRNQITLPSGIPQYRGEEGTVAIDRFALDKILSSTTPDNAEHKFFVVLMKNDDSQPKGCTTGSTTYEPDVKKVMLGEIKVNSTVGETENTYYITESKDMPACPDAPEFLCNNPPDSSCQIDKATCGGKQLPYYKKVLTCKWKCTSTTMGMEIYKVTVNYSNEEHSFCTASKDLADLLVNGKSDLLKGSTNDAAIMTLKVLDTREGNAFVCKGLKNCDVTTKISKDCGGKLVVLKKIVVPKNYMLSENESVFGKTDVPGYFYCTLLAEAGIGKTEANIQHEKGWVPDYVPAQFGVAYNDKGSVAGTWYNEVSVGSQENMQNKPCHSIGSATWCYKSGNMNTEQKGLAPAVAWVDWSKESGRTIVMDDPKILEQLDITMIPWSVTTGRGIKIEEQSQSGEESSGTNGQSGGNSGGGSGSESGNQQTKSTEVFVKNSTAVVVVTTEEGVWRVCKGHPCPI